MRFTTPCFVRVENPQERKELDMWLRDVGYVVDRKFGSFIFARYQTAQHGYEIEYDPADGVINCGTNVPLFKALAAINDENDCYQWFVCESAMSDCAYMVGKFIKSDSYACPRIDGQGTFWRKATAKEIVNHFKNQRS